MYLIFGFVKLKKHAVPINLIHNDLSFKFVVLAKGKANGKTAKITVYIAC